MSFDKNCLVTLLQEVHDVYMTNIIQSNEGPGQLNPGGDLILAILKCSWLDSSADYVSGCGARVWEFDSPQCHQGEECLQKKGRVNHF